MRYILLLLFLAYYSSSIAQTTHNFSMGASYNNGQYYELQNDQTTSVSHSSWDIAFSVYGVQDAGIFINEGAGFSGTPPKLYYVPNKSFADNITAADLGTELKNNEISWANGAFNSLRAHSNALDYGWGSYNTSNHKVEGTVLYVIELGNGTQKKLQIDSLVGGTYYFRYADLNGNNLQQKTISKAAFPNQTLAHFSFSSNTFINAEPTTGWDWLFTRYRTLLYSTNPPTPYNVGGILINRGVEAVIADGINPSTVQITNYSTHADSLTIIGHDWKSFNFSSGWTTDNDRVYFIKTANNRQYKIQFIDFQGSSTGTGTFVKTFLGTFTSIKEPNSILSQFQLFPNPATEAINLTFSLDELPREDLTLEVYNALGQPILERQIMATQGWNAMTLRVDDWTTGAYYCTLRGEGIQWTIPFLVQ